MESLIHYAIVFFAGMGLLALLKSIAEEINFWWEMSCSKKRSRERMKDYIPKYFQRVPMKEDAAEHLLIWV